MDQSSQLSLTNTVHSTSSIPVATNCLNIYIYIYVYRVYKLVSGVYVCNISATTIPLSFQGWPTMSIYKWKCIFTKSLIETHTHTGRWLGVWVQSSAVSCVLTFRVIWKVPPHLAASANPCGYHGNTASRDNMRLVRCAAHVHASYFTWWHVRTQHNHVRKKTHIKTDRYSHVNTCTLHYSSLIHLIYPSFSSLLFPFSLLMKLHKIKPLGLHSTVRKVHTTPFSVVEGLLACRDKRPSNTHTDTHTQETQRHTTCSLITTGSLGFISLTAGVCRRKLTINQHIMHCGVTSQDKTLKNKRGWWLGRRGRVIQWWWLNKSMDG